MKSILTKQEIFDQVVSGLALQGNLSKDSHGSCYYRSPNGLKCAAGIILPDSEYNFFMENRPVHVIDYFKNNFHNKELTLLRTLQRIHDSSDTIQVFLEKAKKLADESQLNFNIKKMY